MGKQMNGQIDNWIYRQMDIQIDGYIDRQIDRYIDREMDIQIDGYIDRQIDGYIYINRQVYRWIYNIYI